MSAEDLVLRDGTPAMAWPLSPDDAAGLQEHWTRLSTQSRHDRFLATVRSLSPGLLRQLVDGVDGSEHVALVLFAFPDGAPEAAAGVGRIVRYTDDPGTADVAVTVADAWQGRGVASALLAELVRRRPRGVRTIRTQVADGNAASLAMLRRLGPTTTSREGPGVLGVQVALDG